MKKTAIIILIIISIISVSCKKEKIVISPLGIHQAYMVTMEDTGRNTVEFFYYNGIKIIAKLLNTRLRDFHNYNEDRGNSEGRFFLRINYLGVFYTLRFMDASNFIMIIEGKKQKFYIPNFLYKLKDLDKHPSFEPLNIIEVRLFDQKIRRDAKIDIVKIIRLLGTLHKSRDKFVSKNDFKLTPDLIIRIEKREADIQLFCKDDTVWISHNSGYYVFKSGRLKKEIEKLKKR